MSLRSFPALLPLLLMAACVGKSTQDSAAVDTADTAADTGEEEEPATEAYSFSSRFNPGESSVSYKGQILRHALIVEMKGRISGLTDRIDSGWTPVPGEVAQELLFYFSFDSATGGPVTLRSSPEGSEQLTFDDISAGKDLVGKLAGNDSPTDHADWSSAFVGWDHPDVSSPESLVRHWIDEIDSAAVARGEGDLSSPAVYLSAEGVDHQQLLQKFLTGAVTFSQGADDYLDDDVEGKGLLADHTVPDAEGKSHTALEHAWDEGFGYFGAARTYGDMSDADIKDVGFDDADGSGTIDLTSEVCWGASINAAKRDLGATADAPTDFTGQAWAGLHGGRALIDDADGALTEDELATLREFRDQAIGAWEGAVAATVVHYINELLQDASRFGTDDHAFDGYAKHWSEAKGFAFWFQFNPRSPLSAAGFSALHDALGMAPVLPEAGEEAVDTFKAKLIETREMLGSAYGFDTANLGDEHGEDGW